MDGGVYENDEISIEEAAEELLEDEGVEFKANGCVDMKRHQWEE